MRRLAPLAVNVGTGVCVLGLGEAHALAHGYSMTGTARFAWSLAYVLALWLAAYGFGLPDVPRTRRRAIAAALGATVAAAAAISMLQLLVGDALLPRAVVFGAALVLVPWYVLCARVAGDARTRAEDRDRVVLVGDLDEADTLRAELDRAPERHAVVVAAVTPEDVSLDDPPHRPLVELTEVARATVLVLSRRAQSSDDVVVQAARLHESGMRVRTLSLFYEQWLGKLPVAELERVSLLFDVGEVHAPRYRAGEAPVRRGARGRRRVGVGRCGPDRRGREPRRQPWAAALPPTPRRPGRPRVLDREVPHHAHRGPERGTDRRA